LLVPRATRRSSGSSPTRWWRSLSDEHEHPGLRARPLLNQKTGQLHVIVDGGMLELPCLALRLPRDEVPDWPTFGLCSRAEAQSPIGARLPGPR
jgi:hypothetical protein